MKKTLFFLFAMLAIAACNKDDKSGSTPATNAFKEGQEVTIKGSFAATKATGTAYEDGSIAFVWSEGDEITVSVGNKKSTFALKSGAGKTEGEFFGTMPADGENFTVSYGDGNSPKTQTYAIGKIDKNLISASGEGTVIEGFSLTLTNAIARFDLFGENMELKSLIVNIPLSSYTIDFGAGIGLGASEYDLTPIFVLTDPCSASMSIDVIDLDGGRICTLETKNASFEAGKVCNLGNFEVVDPSTIHEAVDFGLPSGLKWATTNVGAANPENIGMFVAWGMIEPFYSSYSIDSEGTYTFSWLDEHPNGYTLVDYCGAEKWTADTEWNPVPYEEIEGDSNMRLKASNDVATVKWGAEWRIPTCAEWTELVDNCTFIAVTKGVAPAQLPTYTPAIDGYLVIKGKDAAMDTGTYIFLPAAPRLKNVPNASPTLCYWSSSLYVTSTNKGQHALYFSNKNSIPSPTDYTSRYFGINVRAVTK